MVARTQQHPVTRADTRHLPEPTGPARAVLVEAGEERILFRPLEKRFGCQPLGKPDKLLLDGRSKEEFTGERVGAPGNPDTGALRYGRIPGALSMPIESSPDVPSAFDPMVETTSRSGSSSTTCGSSTTRAARWS